MISAGVSQTAFATHAPSITNSASLTTTAAITAGNSLTVTTGDLTMTAGNILMGANEIQFTDTTQNIDSTAAGLQYDVTSGDTHDFQVATVSEYTMSATIFAINDNILEFSEADQDIIGDAPGGLTYDVTTGDTHDFDVAGTNELKISGTIINAPTNTFQEGGTDISPIGKQEVFVGIGDCTGFAGTPARADFVLSAESAVRTIPMTVSDSVVCYWLSPTNYDATVDLVITILWSSKTAATNTDTVDFLIAVQGYADDDALITAFATGTAVTQDVIGSLEEDLQLTAALTIAPAGDGSGKLFGIEVEEDASDMLTDELLFLGLRIGYSTDAATTD